MNLFNVSEVVFTTTHSISLFLLKEVGNLPNRRWAGSEESSDNLLWSFDFVFKEKDSIVSIVVNLDLLASS